MDALLYTFVARKRDCGCLVGTVPDSPEHAHAVARRVSEWIRAGHEVDRLAVDPETLPRQCTKHATWHQGMAGFEEASHAHPTR